MNIAQFEPGNTELMAALDVAHLALDAGELQRAKGVAQAVLAAAKSRADVYVEALSLSCLANCERVASRLRRASDASRRAVHLFQRLGAVEEETLALTTLAHLSMLLGRNGEAVETALLCVRLCDLQVPRPQSVLAYNCLGISYSWSGNFALAHAALATAVEVASRCIPEVSAYQPKVNQAWVEAARLVDARYYSERLPSTQKLGQLVMSYRQLENSGNATCVVPGLLFVGKALSHILAGLCRCWQQDIDGARSEAEFANVWLRRGNAGTTWLDAVACWLRAEIAWAESDWYAAETCLYEMRDIASRGEHEQLACMAHRLIAQVFELQGKHKRALQEHRSLRRREQRICAESLASREVVVGWQLGARKSEQNVEHLLVASKQFERWSLEDSLTGIANRRCFEQKLVERLQTSITTGQPLSVAMIDVDQFKAVNDRFTHLVGDKVLKVLAEIVSLQLREVDLLARLAGDEFAVLIDGADSQVSLQICERIHAAVALFDWEAIAVGLLVTVSIGVSQAGEGDTGESLLHRSDQLMYKVKRNVAHGDSSGE